MLFLSSHLCQKNQMLIIDLLPAPSEAYVLANSLDKLEKIFATELTRELGHHKLAGSRPEPGVVFNIGGTPQEQVNSG